MRTHRRHLLPFVTAAVAVLAVPATAHACPSSTKFVTPSGNIWCLTSRGSDSANGVVCEIRDHTYTAPPKPEDCHLDWGDRISLKPGSAPVVHCHGDTIFDAGMPTLPYGQTRWAGPITCEAQPSGVTCTDTPQRAFLPDIARIPRARLVADHRVRIRSVAGWNHRVHERRCGTPHSAEPSAARRPP